MVFGNWLKNQLRIKKQFLLINCYCLLRMQEHSFFDVIKNYFWDYNFIGFECGQFAHK